MTYQRVLPRDLFNEAKLLKCLGKLIVEIENKNLPIAHAFEANAAGFSVGQDENDDSIFVSNIRFYAHSDAGKRLYFFTGLNARNEWPLQCTDFNQRDTLHVFNSQSELSEAFINWVNSL